MKKPVHSRVSSQPDRLWNLNLLADVATAMSEYDKSEAQIDEEDARISVVVPRKKRSRRSSPMATQWTTHVRSITCAEGYKEVEDEEERNLTERKTVRRSEVGTSSRSTELEQELPLPSFKKRRPVKFSIKEEERSFKKRKTIHRLEQDTTVPKWLADLMKREEINGHDPKLIVARKLYKSDLDRGQSRLSMPLNQVVSSDFLTEEETRIIYEQSVLKIRKEGISVGLVDPRFKKHVVDLRKRNMNGNWTYVFVDGWNEVVSTNMFEVGEVYTVWSFRSGEGKLCFALVPPPTKTSNGSGHGGSTSGESGLCSR